MKLEEFLLDKTDFEDITCKEEQNLHVIGPCGECEHWGDHPMGTRGGVEMRGCEKLECVSPGNQRFGSCPSKDFGCIHFEPK